MLLPTPSRLSQTGSVTTPAAAALVHGNAVNVASADAADGQTTVKSVTFKVRLAGSGGTFTTIGALSPAELSLKDLKSVELDVAALERDYTRPSQPGFPLEVHIVRL